MVDRDIMNAFIDGAELGAMKFAEAYGLIKPTLNERQAKRIYGKDLKEWAEAGLIKAEQDGPNKNKRYSILRLAALAKASHYSRLEPKESMKS